MPFNTALSGLAAASSELRVTGDNIANAGTVGFKQSRVEFADVFASTGGGSAAQVGSGVKVSDVAQQFDQGTISFTNNALDLAIDGNGFFVVDNNGDRAFTRSGVFKLDRDGFVTTNNDARLQGFEVSASGSVDGILTDLKVDAESLAPRQTRLVETSVNLDARAEVLSLVGTTHVMAGPRAGVAQVGLANGYQAQDIEVVQPDLTFQTISTAANDTAQSIAALFASPAAAGTGASAVTTATIPAATFSNNSGALALVINGVAVTGATLSDLSASINSAIGIATVVASVDTSGDLVITDQVGADLQLSVVTTDPTDSLQVQGVQGAPVTLDSTQPDATVGGIVTFTLDEDVAFRNPVPADNIFGSLDATTFPPFVLNGFDPEDPDTYNSATSVTVFDSLGNPHIMTQYFVKERSVTNGGDNIWSMYVQIDGQDVGDPDRNLPSPDDTKPTRAQYVLEFNPDGSIDLPATDQVLISNWVPQEPGGTGPNGALLPLNVLDGGGLPLADPPTNSNFEVRLNGSTQYGTDFSVNRLEQDGFTTGRLADIGIDPDGFVSARYTNGEAKVLGQLALANFPSLNGLTSLGDNQWSQSSESGEAVIGVPRTGSLGAIVAGAVEESNVELSEQLVTLITAQRNFQANARTISTADETIQTVIQI